MVGKGRILVELIQQSRSTPFIPSLLQCTQIGIGTVCRLHSCVCVEADVWWCRCWARQEQLCAGDVPSPLLAQPLAHAHVQTHHVRSAPTRSTCSVLTRSLLCLAGGVRACDLNCHCGLLSRQCARAGSNRLCISLESPMNACYQGHTGGSLTNQAACAAHKPATMTFRQPVFPATCCAYSRC